MSSSPLLAKAEACIDWYWAHGIQRQERYTVSRGSWLDAIYRTRERAQAMLQAGATPKATMAIWGPSQTGKSTLLSGYLDEDGDDQGHRSALKWSDTEPVRFVVGRIKDDPSIVVLNPYNQNSDASGCVSRFILRDSVPDPLHPVELELATEAQVMHALAVGYVTECAMSNSKGEVENWTADSFSGLLGKYRAAGAPRREAFDLLHQVAETIELLILSDLERYQNLGKNGNWEKSLRGKLLDSPALLGSVKNVEDFAAEFFWDSWPSLTATCKNLTAKRRELAQHFGTRTLRCSYRTAALLLDIDSYKQCTDGSPVQARVNALQFRIDGDTVAIGENLGTPVVRGRDDFGLFQGLVWELRIPLRREVLQTRAPVLCAFLEKADLLDFPGVANAYGAAEKREDKAIAAEPAIALTEILKRGKTASIVVTRARNLDIDGFSLLIRASRFPSQPKQLVSGIKSWLRSYGEDLPPKQKGLPLNLVLTFCAKLVNDVRQSGIRTGLEPSFGQLKELGALQDPRTVTTFATTYGKFDEGRILGSEDEQKTALASILQDQAFKARFGDNAASFEEMARNGGTDYFFQHLMAQATGSRRAGILAQRNHEAGSALAQQIEEHLPSEVAVTEERNRALADWDAAIVRLLEAPRQSRREPDNATKLSRHLRTLLNVDPEELDDLPQNAGPRQFPIDEFIAKQFREWQARRATQGDFAAMGLRDAAQAQKILSYLLEATDLAAIEEFFLENLAHIASRSEAKHARRFLAIKMSSELLRGAAQRETLHRPINDGDESVGAVLSKLAEAEDKQTFALETSPHYCSVIYPLRERLEVIKTLGAGQRPSQPGDAELLQIAQLP